LGKGLAYAGISTSLVGFLIQVFLDPLGKLIVLGVSSVSETSSSTLLPYSLGFGLIVLGTILSFTGVASIRTSKGEEA